MGRHDEALVEAKKASDLDPLNLMIGTWVGLRYYLARKYDSAIDQGRPSNGLKLPMMTVRSGCHISLSIPYLMATASISASRICYGASACRISPVSPVSSSLLVLTTDFCWCSPSHVDSSM